MYVGQVRGRRRPKGSEDGGNNRGGSASAAILTGEPFHEAEGASGEQ